MKYKIFTYDSFTKEKFKGNSAGVVLNAASLTKNSMQSIACELGYSETAFIIETTDEITVRFFTPNSEIDICGHATIAYITALYENNILNNLKEGNNRIYVKNNLGVFPIIVEIQNNNLKNVLMYQDTPALDYKGIENLKSEILDALGIDEQSVDNNFSIVKAYTGLWDLLIPLKNIKILENLKIDSEKIKKISKKLNIISFHPFVMDKNKEFHVRNFAPVVDIPEEAATGTSNGALTYYLYSINKIKDNEQIKIHQGKSMNRESIIIGQIQLENNKVEVLIGGTAVKIIDGFIEI